MKKIRPIFIISLPRSGSTLLQEVLLNINGINSHSETWILLPMLFTLKSEGSLSVYSNEKSYKAIQDVIESFPNKEEDYFKIINNYFTEVITKLSNSNCEYFIEKTPRNYLVIDELARIFPDSKFIFIFRNPIAIINSLLKTKRNNSFKTFYNAKIDLFDGPSMVADGYSKYKSRSFKLVYEEFVINNNEIFPELIEFLSVKGFDKSIEDVKLGKLKGRLGDPNIRSRTKIDSNSAFSWQTEKYNSYRIYLIKKYLKKFDENYLKNAGLNRNHLVKVLDEIPSGKISFRSILDSFKDFYEVRYAYLIFYFKLDLFFKKGNKWLRKNNIE